MSQTSWKRSHETSTISSNSRKVICLSFVTYCSPAENFLSRSTRLWIILYTPSTVKNILYQKRMALSPHTFVESALMLVSLGPIFAKQLKCIYSNKTHAKSDNACQKVQTGSGFKITRPACSRCYVGYNRGRI